MPVSLIITTLNEAKSIEPLLNSIAKQTRIPDETIIVDGGSTDNTTEQIQKFSRQHPELNLRTYTKKGYNRSQGRNYAIEKAKYANIAVTDAGCTLNSNWLELITRPFIQKETQVVAGSYELNKKISDFFKFPALLASPIPQKNNSKFLPSSRSIAFRKNAWDHVNGYPEYLNTAEDLIFSYQLQNKKMNQEIQPNAKVIWSPPATFTAVIKQFWKYAYGDGLSGLNSPHSKRYLLKTVLLIIILWSYLNFFISESILITTMLLGWIILSFLNAKKVSASLLFSLFWTPILLVTTFLGFWAGWIKHMLTPHHG